MPEQTLETTQVTGQSAPAQSPSAPATPEETTLLGAKEAIAPENDDSTLLGKKTVAEGEKKDDATKPDAKVGVPEKYEAKVPEGMNLNQSMVDKMTPVLKKHGISQEAFQEMVDVYAPEIKAQVEAQQQASIDYFKRIVKEWRDTTIKELGADHPKQMSIAARAIDKAEEAGIKGLREMFDETGVGNHPAMVKLLIHYGKMISPDNFPDSGMKKPPLPMTNEEKAKILYS